MAYRKYFGFKVAQRGQRNAVDFFVFVANTKDVMQWSGIKRVGVHEKGTQRILKQTKAKSIERFLSVDPRNTIPVSVLVAFNAGIAQFESLDSRLMDCFPNVDTQNNIDSKIDWGTLTFSYDETTEEHQRPALVVDGQHRLNGMSLLQEDIPVLVAALIDASPDEQAFQFVVINNKADKVPTDNVKAIISDIHENELQDRLLNAGVNYGDVPAALRDIDNLEISPFYKLLDWPLNNQGQRAVNLTAIETCLRYIRNQLLIIEDEDTVKQVFMAIWRSVKSVYPNLWLNNNTFMSKVNIISVNEFVVDRINYAWEGDLIDIFDPDQVERQTATILSNIPEQFWTRKWAIPIQDNAVVRNNIKNDLKMITSNIRARRSWDENLNVLAQD